MTASPQDELQQQRILAALLLTPRDEKGNFTPLDTVAARNLLGKIDSADMGQGAFNLLVPARALETAKLDTSVWEKAALKSRLREGQYEVPYDLAVHGVLPFLEDKAQCKWHEARKLAEKTQSSRTTKSGHTL
jgi:hypothetical protein